ncbi:hypothetical protein E2K80_10315 [Rhodophyticola sp. CCM32]|uniref:DUF6476 family protein n=1 Tax=Rhodophyticola sp. CCM32 TaxID=2916397 RepID=UPI00107F8184|nr:DUF6476 family protein [Rhodophyticola sp. CCM32]QBY01073.1 hypothetical protein E2K80_10315 [Rhodophyticola sp. CCM32]
MMDTPQEDNAPLPGHLRLLRNLVTVLTVVMIFGVIAITGLLVIRLSAPPAPVLVFPEAFALPAGVAMTGYSQLGGQAVIVGDDGVIRVFDMESGEVTREIDLTDE